MSWTFTLWIALLLVVLMGFFAGIAYLAGFTLLGTEVDDEIRGRTFAIVQSLVRAALILSLAVVPFGVGLHRPAPRSTSASSRSRSPASGSCCSSPGCSPCGVGVLAYRQMDDGRPVPLLADVVTALRRDTTARRRLAGGGVFIAFEGGEGAGKSTQVRRLQEWLTNEGLVARATLEPGATPSGAGIRAIVLDPAHTGIASRSEALLYAADRAQHVHDVLRPALDAGEVVITDRFVDSSLAYQGAGRTIPLDDVRMLSRWATAGPAARPHRAARPAARGGPGPRPRPGGRRPAGVGVAGLPPAGPADVPARSPRPSPTATWCVDAPQLPDELAAEIRVRVGRPAVRACRCSSSRTPVAAARRPAAATTARRAGAPHHPHAQTGATPQLHP